MEIGERASSYHCVHCNAIGAIQCNMLSSNHQGAVQRCVIIQCTVQSCILRIPRLLSCLLYTLCNGHLCYHCPADSLHCSVAVHLCNRSDNVVILGSLLSVSPMQLVGPLLISVFLLWLAATSLVSADLNPSHCANTQSTGGEDARPFCQPAQTSSFLKVAPRDARSDSTIRMVIHIDTTVYIHAVYLKSV